jgi:hypothetical protein
MPACLALQAAAGVPITQIAMLLVADHSGLQEAVAAPVLDDQIRKINARWA